MESRRHRGRLLGDAALVSGLIAAMVAEALLFPHNDLPMPDAGWPLLLLVTLPVLLRRTRPVLGLVCSLTILLPLTAVCPIVQTSPISAMVCGYWVARTRGRRQAILSALLITPYVLFLLGHHDPEKLLTWETPKNLVLVMIPLVLGLTVRYREQSMQALVDRAEAAERTREQEAQRRVDEERMRIAREIHDVVSHSMVAINVQAGVGAHLIRGDVDRAEQTLRDIRRLSSDTLGELRGILGILRSDDRAPVTPTTTLDSLPELVDGMRAAGLDVELTMDVTGPVPSPSGLTAARVVQESLTNALRHAPGAPVRVGISRSAQALHVEVDNGESTTAAGSLPVPRGSGAGLIGLEERLHALGGDLRAGPVTSGGWNVRATVPVPAGEPS